MPEHSAATSTTLLDRDDHSVVQPLTSTSGTRHGIVGWGSLVTRLAGAVAVVGVGVVHLQAHDGPYAAVPTIGELFLVNFVAATTIGVTLLLPIERLDGRWGAIALVLVTIAGIGLAAGSLAMLIVSEHGILFGFHEPGYDPQAISRSRGAEIATIGLLGASLTLRSMTRARPRW